MNILITGSGGFVGKNLTEALKNIRGGKDRTHPALEIGEIFECTRATSGAELEAYCKDADFVFNLAGVNRPQNTSEFYEGNRDFGEKLLSALRKAGNRCPVMLSSSIQASLAGRYAGSDYGKSKLAGEELFFEYAEETGARALVYRFPNLFGKWCRPNYNSAVATFCNNIANDLPIRVNDPSAELLESFAAQPKTLLMPEIPNGSFEKKLYSTYLSYLPESKVCFPLKMNADARGSFTELLKTAGCGQFSVNISKPGVTKGQHWHNSKWEFFIVVAGNALIRERKIGTDEVFEFRVCGEKIEAVHMLPGYTHDIINLSETENLVTLMWANEIFDAAHPDTFFEAVEK